MIPASDNSGNCSRATRNRCLVETFNLRSDPVPGGPPPPPVPKDYKYTKIPTRYGDAKESGLGFDVVRGDQTKDFNLTP